MTRPERETDDLFEPDEDEDDMFNRRERVEHRRWEGPRVSEFVRRAIENTVGSVQGGGNIPKEAINYLLQQGDRGRREIVRIVAKEVGDFLRATDLSTEVVKILTNVQVDMSASIRFKRNPEGRLTTEIGEDSQMSVHGTEPPEPEVEGEDDLDDPRPPAGHEPE